MVRHQAVREEAPAKLRHRAGQEAQICLPIAVVAIDHPPVVPAGENVRDAVGNLLAGLARHAMEMSSYQRPSPPGGLTLNKMRGLTPHTNFTKAAGRYEGV